MLTPSAFKTLVSICHRQAALAAMYQTDARHTMVLFDLTLSPKPVSIVVFGVSSLMELMAR
jgi:hypothetical protein